MRSLWAASAAIAFVIGSAMTAAGAAEIRLAEQFSMGYLQFNVMKRDRLIEKYATQRGLKDFKVSWQRFNGPVAMNEALLSNSTDIVSGGVPGLITLWDKTQGTSFEVKGICALSSQPFLLNTANPDIKSIKDFSERDRIAVPSIKVSVQAVLLQMAAAEAYGEANYGKLDPLTKELVYLAVSITNQCEYCIASHGAMARQKGMTEEMHEEFMAIVLAAQKGNKIAMAYRVPVDAAFEEK